MGLFFEAYWEGHWGSLGFRGMWPTMESTAADSTVAHFSCNREQQYYWNNRSDRNNRNNAIGCYTKTFRLTELAQQDMQEQQDTQPDNRIHGWTTGSVAGLQDTQPNSRICGWTTGYTAKQQDTWLDYGIHSQTAGYAAGLQDTQLDTGYVDTPQQQHFTAAGTRDRSKGAEPKPRHYFGSFLSSYNRNRRK